MSRIIELKVSAQELKFIHQALVELNSWHGSRLVTWDRYNLERLIMKTQEELKDK